MHYHQLIVMIFSKNSWEKRENWTFGWWSGGISLYETLNVMVYDDHFQVGPITS